MESDLGIIYMTKHNSGASYSARQADALSIDEIEITPAMVEAGLEAYAALAWHDSASVGSPRDVVTEILRRGISADTSLAARLKS